MDKNKIRVGIIGAGTNTRKMHLPLLQSIEGVEIVEVANRSRESAQKVADEFNIPVVKDRWQDVAESTDIDAVVIGTWPYLHRDATCLALQSGKHVLCEARMAMNESEGLEMLKASKQNPQCVAQLVPSPFTLRIDKTIAKFIAENKLGRLYSFQFEYQSPPKSQPGNELHWRRNIKYSGVNTMVLGIAYESIARWFGPAQWVSAEGNIFNDTAIDPESGSEVKIEVPDYLSVQMQMKNGMMGSFHIDETSHHAEPPNLTIFGEAGTLRYHFAVDGELYFGSPDDKEMRPVNIPKEDESHWRVEEEFINAIRGNEEIKYTAFADGVEYMKFTEAAIKSFHSNGTRLTLPPI